MEKNNFWNNNQPKMIAESKEGLICFTAVVITIIICVTILMLNI